MKLFIHLGLLILVFFAFETGYGSNRYGTIRGLVITSDGQPAAYVSVLIKNTAKGAITDVKGNFEINKINPGIYILVVSLLDYTDSVITVEVKENETVLLNIQLHQTYAQLKEVIIRANPDTKYAESKISESLRLNLPLNEIPQNITITTRQILSDQGLLSMTEAIRNVSGIQKYAGGLNDYQLNIRGTDATWSVFRNGVGGYSWNQQEDVAMLEKIEFVKGPAGFMINVAQPGGIVNIITKQPTQERIANINAGFGSYNMMRMTADLGGPLSKNARLTYRFNAGFHTQDRAFQFSKAFRYFICAAIKYEINEKTSITAENNYMYGRTSGNNVDVPSLNGRMFSIRRNFAVADASTDVLKASDQYYRIKLKHNFNDNWHLNAQAAYVHGPWGGYMLDADDNVPVSNDTLYRAANFSDFREFSVTIQAYTDGKFFTGRKIEHNVLLGIDYCSAGFTIRSGGTWGEKEFGLYIPQPQYYVNTDSLKNYPLPVNPQTKLNWGWSSLYLQDHIKIAEKLVVTIAGHFTHSPLTITDTTLAPEYQRYQDFNVFAPRVGLTWLFSPDVSIYALYDQCFWPQEAPNFQQKPFLPLTGYDLETGMKSYLFGRKLSLNFSVFDIVKNNTLTADPVHQGFSIQTGQVTSKGVDFDVTGNISPAFAINANYEYCDAKITSDSDPTNIGVKNLGTPDHYGNLWLKYILQSHKLKGMSFAMGYQYMGKRSAVWYYDPDPATRFLPVYNLLDAALSYTNEKFYISLNVYNITNTNYASRGSYTQANEWRYTPGEPINFRLSFGINLIYHKKK